MRIVTTVLLVLVLSAGTARAGDEPEFDGKPASWWAGELGAPRLGVNPLRSERAAVALARGSGKAVPVLAWLVTRSSGPGNRGLYCPALEVLSGLSIHDREAGLPILLAMVPCTADSPSGELPSQVLRTLSAARPDLLPRLRDELARVIDGAADGDSPYLAELLLVEVSDGSPDCVNRILQLAVQDRLMTGFRAYLKRHDREVLGALLDRVKKADEKEEFEYAKLLSLYFGLPPILGFELPKLVREPGRTLDSYARKDFTKWCRDPKTTFVERRRAYYVLSMDLSSRLAVLSEMKKDAVEAPGFAKFATETLAEKGLDPKVRFTLLRVAGHLPVESRASLLPHLIAALAHEDDALRQMAAEIIGTLGPAAREAIPALEKGLEDPGKWVPETCAIALGNIGPAAKSAIPALEKAVESKDTRLAAAAKAALEKIRRE